MLAREGAATGQQPLSSTSDSALARIVGLPPGTLEWVFNDVPGPIKSENSNDSKIFIPCVAITPTHDPIAREITE